MLFEFCCVWTRCVLCESFANISSAEWSMAIYANCLSIHTEHTHRQRVELTKHDTLRCLLAERAEQLFQESTSQLYLCHMNVRVCTYNVLVQCTTASQLGNLSKIIFFSMEWLTVCRIFCSSVAFEKFPKNNNKKRRKSHSPQIFFAFSPRQHKDRWIRNAARNETGKFCAEKTEEREVDMNIHSRCIRFIVSEQDGRKRTGERAKGRRRKKWEIARAIRWTRSTNCSMHQWCFGVESVAIAWTNPISWLREE